jgi:hypothetical protein
VEEEVKMEVEEVEEVVLTTTSSTPHHDVPPAEAGHLRYQCCGSGFES